MFCNECGSRAPAGKRFCPKCGASFGDADAAPGGMSSGGALKPGVKRIEVKKEPGLSAPVGLLLVVIVGVSLSYGAIRLIGAFSGEPEPEPPPVEVVDTRPEVRQQEMNQLRAAVELAVQRFWNDVAVGRLRMYEIPEDIKPWTVSVWAFDRDNRIMNELRAAWRRRLADALGDYERERSRYIDRWGQDAFNRFASEQGLTVPDPRLLDMYEPAAFSELFSGEERARLEEDVRENRIHNHDACMQVADSYDWKAIAKFCHPVRSRYQQQDAAVMGNLTLAYYYTGDYYNACEQMRTVDMLYDQMAGEIPSEQLRNRHKMLIQVNIGAACRDAGDYEMSDRYFKLAQSRDQLHTEEGRVERSLWIIYYEWAGMQEAWGASRVGADMDSRLQDFVISRYGAALEQYRQAFAVFADHAETEPLIEALIARKSGEVAARAAQLGSANKDKLIAAARNDLMFALQKDPLAVEALKWLGVLSRLEEDNEQALDYFSRYYLGVTNPDERAEVGAWIEKLGGIVPEDPVSEPEEAVEPEEPQTSPEHVEVH